MKAEQSKKKMLIKYESLWHDIDQAILTKSSLVIAIDGHSTSGKSTLANLIGELYDANVFHMDDFYRSQSQGKSSLVYANNIDFERLETEVIIPLSEQKEIEYKAFNCKTQQLLPAIHQPYRMINVIEGAYSMHPQIVSVFDIKVFLKSTYLQQIRRIIKRNGKNELKMFIKKWIPFERKYFKHFKIKQQSDYVFKSLH